MLVVFETGWEDLPAEFPDMINYYLYHYDINFPTIDYEFLTILFVFDTFTICDLTAGEGMFFSGDGDVIYGDIPVIDELIVPVVYFTSLLYFLCGV